MSRKVERVSAFRKLLRVEQWYKNLMLGVPAIFALKLGDASIYPRLLLGYITLSLASSSVYIFNDIRDLEADRAHPIKRFRPLASGQISIKEAFVMLALLLVSSILLASMLDKLFTLLVILFITLSTFYSLFLKRIAVVDVTSIALNYLIRVVSGAVLIKVEASSWLVSGFFFLALFLALSKRKAELVTTGSGARDVLKIYSQRWLDQALAMAAAMTIVTYAVYCAEAPLGRRLVPTIPVMAFFLLRYTLALEVNNGEHPHEIIMRDKPTLISALLLVASVITLVYLPIEF